MRVLVVDDDEHLADDVARGLGQTGMAGDIASAGDDALFKIEITHRYAGQRDTASSGPSNWSLLRTLRNCTYVLAL